MNESTDRNTEHNGHDARRDAGAHGAQDTGTGMDRAGTERPMIPRALRLVALAIIAVGAGWLLFNDDSPPTLESQPVGSEQDGYRLVTGRVSPPESEELSDTFVRATGMLREQVLQRLSELKAEWRVAAPRVTLRPYDVQGDAVAFAEQLEGWLEQHDLLAGETVAVEREASGEGPDGAGTPANSQAANSSAQNVVEGDLPAPPAPGLVIRSRSDDVAIARDLALALAPVIGGEVNVLPDERVDSHHLVVALIGAPRFGEDGVAYFQAQ